MLNMFKVKNKVPIVNFEYIPHLVLVFLLLTLNIIAGWVVTFVFRRLKTSVIQKTW